MLERQQIAAIASPAPVLSLLHVMGVCSATAGETVAVTSSAAIGQILCDLITT